MNRNEIEDLTLKYGTSLAYSHVQRILKLIDIIGEGLEYDKESIWYAVYLHDWGAFPNFRQTGIDHAIRSRQIAEDILQKTDFSQDRINNILEAIEIHDYRNASIPKTNEAILLRDADSLEFLGMIGIVREFASGINDLKKCYRISALRRNDIRNKLILPISQSIAKKRIEQMDECFKILLENSLGCL